MNTSKNTIESIYNLTPTQQGILYHHLSEPNSGQYILQQTFNARGVLPEDAVQGALTLLARRHDVLRTAFVVPKTSGKPRQILLADRPAEFHTADLTATATDAQPQCLRSLEAEDIARGFNLEHDPLIRLTLVRLAHDASALILTAHHIILDGWSLPIIMSDFARYCASLLQGQAMPVLAAAAASDNHSLPRYAQYIRWLEAQDTSCALAYWQTLLDGYKETADIAPLYAPTAASSASSAENTPVRVQSITLSAQNSQRLMSAAAAEGTTISTLLTTAWGLLLQRYNNTDDVVFGKVVSGRNAPLTGIEGMAGLFINTIPVRVQTCREQTVRSLLREQQDQALASDEHSYCALSDIQKVCAHTQGKGLFSTLFAFENYFIGETTQQNIRHIELSAARGREQTNYPLSLRAYSDSQIHTDIMYSPSQYTDEDVFLLLRRYHTLLLSFTEGINQPVCHLSYLDSEEHKQLFNFSGASLSAVSSQPATLPSADSSPTHSATIGSAFSDIAAQCPHKSALHMENASMTYAELDERSNRLARTLRKLGIGPDSLVALFACRRFECIVGILGILKAGGVYLPIDPDTPAERTAFILRDSTPKAMLFLGNMPAAPPNIPCLDLLNAAAYDADSSPLSRVNTPQDLAYCIYTSGTTGQPKGVLIEHQGLINLIRASHLLGIGSNDRMLQFANYTFDVTLWEIFCALLKGATLVMIAQDVILDNNRFLSYVQEQKITAALLPPHYYRQGKLAGLRLLLTGGSAATPDIVERASQAGTYWNAYGPTEITVLSHFWSYMPGTSIPDPIPIGKPITNMSSYILQGTQLCGAGIPGELCIGGQGLARGYLNRPKLTGEKFIENPFAAGRLYRTGDLARWLPDGNVEYLGRIDDQAKIRGYRVEPGEVESALRALPDITDAVVVVRQDLRKALSLHAYVTAGTALNTEDLRAQLTHKLPSYMIPALFAQIDKIPVNRSGKPDTSALPPITPSLTKIQEPRNDLETQALNIFKKTLNLGQMSMDQDFFDAGGDSIKAIQIASQLGTLNLSVTVRDIFSLRTVERIVADALARQASPLYPDVPSTNTPHPHTASQLTDFSQSTETLWQKIQEPLAAYKLQGPVKTERTLSVTQRASVRMGILGSLGAAEIHSPWDSERFQTAWRRLLAETPSLCSAIRLNSDRGTATRPDWEVGLPDWEVGLPDWEVGLQREYTGLPDTVPFIDLSSLSSVEQTRILNQLSFRLAEPYMTTAAYTHDFLCAHRLLCAKTGPQHFLVLMPISHLVFDGFSNEVFARRLRELYTRPDTAPAFRACPPEDYDTFVLQGPENVSDDGLVHGLALDLLRDSVTKQRTLIHPASQQQGWEYGTFSFPLNHKTPSPADLLSLGERLCAGALRFAQPAGMLPFLLVTSARNYTGCNFSNSIGEFIDLAPVVWQEGESFAAARQRVLLYMREHRVNICALMHSPELARRYPRATKLLRETLRLEQLDIQAINLLVLYGSHSVTPDRPQDIQPAAPRQHNRNQLQNIYAQNGSITVENIKYETGKEHELRAHLSSLLAK